MKILDNHFYNNYEFIVREAGIKIKSAAVTEDMVHEKDGLAKFVTKITFLKLIITSNLPLNKVLLYYILFYAILWYLIVIYKNTLLLADQKGYTNNNITTVVTIILNITQISILNIFRNFVVYLVS